MYTAFNQAKHVILLRCQFWYCFRHLKAHYRPIPGWKTTTVNLYVVTTCKVMFMYEITINKSFATQEKDIEI